MKNISKIIFILTTAMNKRAIAVLDMLEDIDDFITQAKGIHDSMVNSSYFAALAAKLTLLNTHITTLVNKHTAFKTTPPTATKAQRDDALEVVQNDLRELQLEVQLLANADPDHAEDIITSADMKVKKQATVDKQDFTAESNESGKVTLVAKGLTERHSNEWEMSKDGTTWTRLTSTLAGTTEVEDLEKGSIQKFRHRYILKDGPTEWSQTVEVTVK